MFSSWVKLDNIVPSQVTLHQDYKKAETTVLSCIDGADNVEKNDDNGSTHYALIQSVEKCM